MNRGLGSSIAAALASVLLAFGLAGTSAHAATSSLVTSESGITADGLIDWGALGPEPNTVSQPFTIAVPNVSVLSVTVSQSAGNFQRVDQSSLWLGNFAAGEKLLSTCVIVGVSPHGPVRFVFNSPDPGRWPHIHAVSCE